MSNVNINYTIEKFDIIDDIKQVCSESCIDPVQFIKYLKSNKKYVISKEINNYYDV